MNLDGPFTVFVPSNDALQKVPDNDLEIIRRNMTALKGFVLKLKKGFSCNNKHHFSSYFEIRIEFLMYHVAEGVHYSQDLQDGQFLTSILPGQYLQAGVRIDGCSRKLMLL